MPQSVHQSVVFAPINCTKCAALCKGRENVVHGEHTYAYAAFDDGNIDGDSVGNIDGDMPLVMLLGRNPGKEEDNIGRPFVGRAGKKLRELTAPMENISARFYYTNQVKCYTPADREPTEDEVDNCKPYLVQEIEAVAPDAIVLFGLQIQEIWGFKKEHRSFVRVINGIPTIPTYHPSYAARGNKEAEGVISKDIWTAIRLAKVAKDTRRTHV
jgi:uracil-DNA glycosylase